MDEEREIRVIHLHTFAECNGVGGKALEELDPDEATTFFILRVFAWCRERGGGVIVLVGE